MADDRFSRENREWLDGIRSSIRPARDGETRCPECGGSGRIEVHSENEYIEPCRTCTGSGLPRPRATVRR